jgi:hypothetical protein
MASLALLLATTQAPLFAQYTISTLATSTTTTILDGRGVAVDQANNVFATAVVPWPNIVKASAAGLPLAVGSNSSNAPFNGCGQPATNEGFTDLGLGGLFVDRSGNIYIAQSGNGPVLRVNGTVSCLVSDQYFWGNGVVADNAGNVYFASAGDYRVYKAAPGAATAVVVAGTGTSGCTNGSLVDPMGLALDSNGYLYIADQSCNVVWKVNTSSPGTLVAAAGMPVLGEGAFSGDGGPAASAQLSAPSGLAVDLFGNLYIADKANQRIRKVSGGIISTIAGNGAWGFSGDGGPALNAELYNPLALAVGLDGRVYIGDSTNQRIRVLTPSWATITSPVPGSVLPGTSVTFTWSGGPAGSTNTFEVNDAQGNVYYSNSALVGQQSATVSNLPCDGRPIYAQLGTYVNGQLVNPGTYSYSACQMLGMSVSPTSLPQAGGTVSISIVEWNTYPGSTLTLTESFYPQFCLPTCPKPIVLATWTSPSSGWFTPLEFYSYSLNVPGLPPAYKYARDIVINATVTLGGAVKDSSTAIVFQQ